MKKPTCKDCIFSGIRFEKDRQGVEFLCKCKFHKWAKFLRHDWCEHGTIGTPDEITIIDGENIKSGKISLTDL